MTDSDSLMDISDDDDDDEQDLSLYIDETVSDCQSHSNRQANKSTNTGNSFELDLFFLANINRYQTRSSQTLLTSHVNLLFQRNRSTICQAEYFSTMVQATNTEQDYHQHEERIPVVKRQRLSSPSFLI